MTSSETIYYPVYLNISGKNCIVVGGGQVALRKVTGLLECGGKVAVISPELCSELDELAVKKEIRSVLREFRAGDLKGSFVVIAATDDRKINRQVAAEAREKGILINTVDDTDYCDFIAPSIIRRGEITIAISTSGQSPALARKLRARLEKEFGEEYAQLGRLIGEVRTEARKQKIEVDGEGWQAALDLDRLLDLLNKGEAEKAKAALFKNLKTRQRKSESK